MLLVVIIFNSLTQSSIGIYLESYLEPPRVCILHYPKVHILPVIALMRKQYFIQRPSIINRLSFSLFIKVYDFMTVVTDVNIGFYYKLGNK